MLIARKGVGDLLADGVKLAAKRIGQSAAELSVDAGGQELAMHDPRNDPGFALHAAVDVGVPLAAQGPTRRYDPRIHFRAWTEF